jgi:hypothetical protein
VNADATRVGGGDAVSSRQACCGWGSRPGTEGALKPVSRGISLPGPSFDPRANGGNPAAAPRDMLIASQGLWGRHGRGAAQRNEDESGEEQ